MRHVAQLNAEWSDRSRAFCSGCRRYLAIDKFTICQNGVPFCYCKVCNSARANAWNKLNPDIHRLNMQRWRLRHPEWSRLHNLSYQREEAYWRKRQMIWQRVGMKFCGKPLTLSVFMKLLELQGYACAISGVDSAWVGLVPDHDHANGELRGILSRDVNHHALAVYERYHRYRSPNHEAALQAYLDNPPALRWREELLHEQQFNEPWKPPSVEKVPPPLDADPAMARVPRRKSKRRRHKKRRHTANPILPVNL